MTRSSIDAGVVLRPVILKAMLVDRGATIPSGFHLAKYRRLGSLEFACV